MKTFGRILMIVVAFAIMMGITYSVVNASGVTSNRTPEFQRGDDGFAPTNGERREFHDDDHDERGGSGFGLMFGLIKNTIIVAFIVALIAFPKKLLQQKRRMVPIQTD